MERKYLIDTPYVRIRVSDMPCPSCGKGKLSEYKVLGAGFKEMMKEISHPWLMLRVFYKMYLGTAKNMFGFFPQYECSSCKTNAAICPHCSKAWVLKKPLEHCERMTCPHCQVESYFSLDR